MGWELIRKPKEPGTTRKKRQFSKMHVVFADCLVLLVWCMNFYLVLHGYTPISDLSLTIVTVYGGFATGGYYVVNGIRDTSLNKHNALRREDYKEGDA